MKATGDRESQPENPNADSETDNEGEEQVMIDWALEWRQKSGAPIIT